MQSDLHTVMEASGFDEATTKAAFDMLDKNKSGKIDRKELAAADLQFWMARVWSERELDTGTSVYVI